MSSGFRDERKIYICRLQLVLVMGKIIDAHMHIFRNTKTKLMKQLKEGNIEKSLILDYYDKKDKDLGYERQKLIEIIKTEPKLVLAASYDMVKNDEKELRFIDRNMKNNNYIALKLYPGYQHVYPNERKCNRLYRLCLKHDVPVMFHSGSFGIQEGAILKYAQPIFIDDVATRFPDLKIIICHLGNPFLEQTMAVMEKNMNVYADLSGLVDDATDCSKHSKNRFESLIEYVGMERLIFGSDCDVTQENIIDYIKFVRTLIPREYREDIFYNNAKKIFKLS